MNPYWINPAPDTDEWLHSDRVKKNFFLLVAGHVALWIVSFIGVIFLFINAQQTAPIEAFTASGEPAWGMPISVSTPQAGAKQEEFLNLHLKNVISYLFMRTEKGSLPQLNDYTDNGLMALVDANFGFTKKVKAGYSQSFYILPGAQDFEILAANASRRIYRVHGILSSHSLDGSANTPVFLIVAIDHRPATTQNPLGWVISVVISVDSNEFYNKERQDLVTEVTKSHAEDTAKKSPDSQTPKK